MRGRAYHRLGLVEFSRELIRTGDLDPVYTALTSVGDQAQLRRWLVAYWCFYHCGLACWASERTGWDFWDEALAPAARNSTSAPVGGRWPRGHERRHARGASGVLMIDALRSRYGSCPEDMVDYLAAGAPDYEGVAGRVQEHRLFGPWIAFKVADMLERVLRVHVDFSEAVVFMFDQPARAALLFWDEHFAAASGPDVSRSGRVSQVVDYLKLELGHLAAPPHDDRLVSLQEIETCLCKWKGHVGGHYPLLNDLNEIRAGCAVWRGVSPTARRFAQALPGGSRCTGTLW